MGKKKPSCEPLWQDCENLVSERYPNLLIYEHEAKVTSEYETRHANIFGADVAAYEADFEDELDRFFKKKFEQQKLNGTY